jgi:hypothetical protein
VIPWSLNTRTLIARSNASRFTNLPPNLEELWLTLETLWDNAGTPSFVWPASLKRIVIVAPHILIFMNPDSFRKRFHIWIPESVHIVKVLYIDSDCIDPDIFPAHVNQIVCADDVMWERNNDFWEEKLNPHVFTLVGPVVQD